jgi:hypothetical protein
MAVIVIVIELLKPIFGLFKDFAQKSLDSHDLIFFSFSTPPFRGISLLQVPVRRPTLCTRRAQAWLHDLPSNTPVSVI